jgi:hypothetical protein
MAVLMAIGVAAGAEAAERGEIFCDARVVEQSWELLKAAHFGLGRQEEAAFVVRDAAGALSLVPWPSTGEAMASHFTGKLPANTVAIVHTHPLDHLMPSPDDQKAARILGVPVYVLMRTGVTRTAGTTNETLMVGDWNPARSGVRRPAACPAVILSRADGEGPPTDVR